MKRHVLPWLLLVLSVSGMTSVQGLASRAEAGSPGNVRIAASSVRCDICKERISSRRYFTYKKRGAKINVCPSCDKSSARCSGCKIPLPKGGFVVKAGERLCKTCARQAIYCKLCGKRVQGQHVVDKQNGDVYCNRCYAATPKCKHCRLPSPRGQVDSEGLCPKCRATLPKCRACGQAIVGDRYSLKFESGEFCTHCVETRPACSACGCPVTDTYWKFPDGRAMCDDCKRRGILKRPQAKQVFDEARALLKKHLGMVIQHDIELVLEEQNKNGKIAASISRRTDDNGSPLSASELGLFRQKGDEFTVFLLYGMPKEMMLETAVHELTHAWQSENCPSGQSLRVREGFAQWTAARILRAKGYQKVLAKLAARNDDPYGTGYKVMKRLEQRYGKTGLVQKIKTLR